MPDQGSALPPPLPDEVLARRANLPVRPAPVELIGQRVRLRPLDIEKDLAVLHAISNGSPLTIGDRHVEAYDPDALVWRYLFGGPFETPDGMRDYLQMLWDWPNCLPLCVLDAPTGHPIGVACYMNNVPEHLKIELGSIWYSPIAQGIGANTEATYLMLDHAFGLGYRRLEWKCNALNERSRRSALRMGFSFEGIQDSYFIVKGRNRDTAWFRILDSEWPQVKAHLERLLAGGDAG